MKANELRSGSVISINGETVIVDHIKCHEDSVTIKNGFAIVFNDGDLETDGNDKIKPIGLTPEILEKCGFVLKDNTFYTKDNIISIAVFDGKLSTTYVCGDNQVNQVKHIHQLQNLYFAMTGEELEVKL